MKTILENFTYSCESNIPFAKKMHHICVLSVSAIKDSGLQQQQIYDEFCEALIRREMINIPSLLNAETWVGENNLRKREKRWLIRNLIKYTKLTSFRLEGFGK